MEAVLPALFDCNDITLEEGRIGGGGYSDLYAGMHGKHGKVALKRLRVGGDRNRQLQRFIGEVGVWKGLQHPHVLPFLGIWIHENALHLVSPFIENGTLFDFIRVNPKTDRIKLLRDIADGLAYLHRLNVVHGDLKALNVLISGKTQAMVSDFGLSKAMDDTGLSGNVSGSARWQSPERLKGGHRSMTDDVYAYGITVYETLSGQIPFSTLNDLQVMAAVMMRQARPPKQPTVSGIGQSYATIWIIAEYCWGGLPQHRPSMTGVLNGLSRLIELSGDQISCPFADEILELMYAPVSFDNVSEEAEQGKLREGPAQKSERPSRPPSDRINGVHRDMPRNMPRNSTHPIDDLAITTDKRIEALPRTKSALYDSQRTSDLALCLQGTRTEVLAKIFNWAGSQTTDTEPVFLLSGMAGTGKTTIAYTIATLTDETEKMLGASYFFSSQEEEDLRRIDQVISTIAYQLSRFDAEYKYHLAQALEDDPDLASKTRQKQIQGLIIGPLQRISRAKPIIIVLDALDECGERGSTEILQLILTVATKITLPLRFFITSRPEPHILSVFSRDPRHQRLILHDIEAAVVRSDIKLFLREQLAHINFDAPVSPDWMTPEQLDTLVEDSGMLFIYAVTAVRFIRDNRVHSPLQQLELLLKQSRPLRVSNALADLDELYLKLLLTMESTRSPQLSLEQVRKVIGTLLLLRNPLSLRALTRFLAVNDGYVRAALRPLQSVIILPKSDEGVARTFHQSFADFVTNPHRCNDQRFLIDIAAYEKLLVIRCLRTMLSGLHYNMANMNDPLLSKSDIPGLLERIKPEMSYACRFWTSHLCKIRPNDSDVLPLVEKFSSLCILWWIEVNSILNSLSTAVSSLSEAGNWVVSIANRTCLSLMTPNPFKQSSTCVKDTSDVLNDAYRFLLANANLINRFPLQVYASALPFVPHSTALHRMYCSNAFNTVKVLFGREESWPAPLSIWPVGYDINAVAFSSDGTRVVSGSDDKIVRIWDTISGEVIATLEGHTQGVVWVTYSPDGTRVFSGSWEETLIWDAISGDVLANLKCDWAVGVSFSPDGSRFVSGSANNTLGIWDVVSGRPIFTFEGHNKVIRSVAFSSDGSRVVSGSGDGTVRIWDSISAEILINFDGHSGGVNSVSFSPDGSRVVSGSDDKHVQIWDASVGGLVTTLDGHTDTVRTVAFSANGSRVVSGSEDQTIRIWDALSGGAITVLENRDTALWSVVFSPDRSQFLSSSSEGAWMCDTFSGDVLTELGGISSMAYSPDGSRAVSGCYDDTIRIWDPKSVGNLTAALGCHKGQVKSIEFSPDGSRLLSSSWAEAWIRDPISGDIVTILKDHKGRMDSMKFSPSGGQILAWWQQETWIWNATSGNLLATLPGRQNLAFSHDGSQFVAISKDKTIQICDAISGEIITALQDHSGAIISIIPAKSSPDIYRMNSFYRLPIDSEDIVVMLDGYRCRLAPPKFSLDGSHVQAEFRLRDIEDWPGYYSMPRVIWDANSGRRAIYVPTRIDYWDCHTASTSLGPRNRFTIENQWLTLNNGDKDGPFKLCKLPSHFARDKTLIAGHISLIAMGDEDGFVTVLDVSSHPLFTKALSFEVSSS